MRVPAETKAPKGKYKIIITHVLAPIGKEMLKEWKRLIKRTWKQA